jgi:hypothetical protein
MATTGSMPSSLIFSTLGLLRPGGIVFVDDYHLPGIARAVFRPLLAVSQIHRE